MNLEAGPDSGASRGRDARVVEAQIGRPLRARSPVAVRCPLGLPVVVDVPAVLEDGTPFPTRYWLTCPLAVKRVGRLESIGGVRRMDTRRASDPAFRAALDEAHARYAAGRDEGAPCGALHLPTGGVGGSSAGVKCLHAHYADHAAGNSNPVGTLVAPWIEPLDCVRPCVVGEGPDVARDPAWSEPR